MSEASERLKFSKPLVKNDLLFQPKFPDTASRSVSQCRALFETIRDAKRELLSGWENVKEILSYLIDILRGEGIDSSELLNSNYVLLAPFYYLLVNNKVLESDLVRRKCTYWVLIASME